MHRHDGQRGARQEHRAAARAAAVTTTGAYKCKVQRYSAALTVTDLGVVTP